MVFERFFGVFYTEYRAPRVICQPPPPPLARLGLISLNFDISINVSFCREYSTDVGDPYYPVPNDRNKNLYKKYQVKNADSEMTLLTLLLMGWFLPLYWMGEGG